MLYDINYSNENVNSKYTLGESRNKCYNQKADSLGESLPKLFYETIETL